MKEKPSAAPIALDASRRRQPLVPFQSPDGAPLIDFAEEKAERGVTQSLDERISREGKERTQNVAQFFSVLGIEGAQEWFAMAKYIEKFAQEYCVKKETRVSDSLREILGSPTQAIPIVRNALFNGVSFVAMKEKIHENQRMRLLNIFERSSRALCARPDIFRWFLSYSGLDRVMSVEEHESEQGHRTMFYMLPSQTAYHRLGNTVLAPQAFTYICDVEKYPFLYTDSSSRNQQMNAYVQNQQRQQALQVIEHRFVRDDVFRAAQEAVHESPKRFSLALRTLLQSLNDASPEWQKISALPSSTVSERESLLTAAKAFAVKGEKMHAVSS